MSNVYFRNTLTGGGTALDGVSYSQLSDGDKAFVDVSDIRYGYDYDSSSSSAENSPNVIKPDDNSGNGRWILQEAYAVSLYYNGSAKLAATSAGISATGNVDINSGHMYQDDEYAHYFGTDSDAAIHHNGSDFYINNDTGNTQITANGVFQVITCGGSEYGLVVVSNGAVTLYYDNSIKLATTSAGVSIIGNADPATDDTYDLGNASYRWDDVYATNTTIQSSDERLKKDITDISMGLDFVKALRPIAYKWETGSRPHTGFSAQEVKATMDAKGIDDWAGFIKSPLYKEIETEVTSTGLDGEEITEIKKEVTDEIIDYRYGLRTVELIPILVKAIQEQQAQIDTLEARIAALEA